MTQNIKVGFIGLGAMGKPMAMRIADAGWPLIVYNRTASAARPFMHKGIELAASPEDLAQRSDVIIIMVSDDAAVRDVAFRPDGVFAGIGEGKIVIDMSTTSPELALDLEAAAANYGAASFSAKVSGSTDAASEGKLLILAGGGEDVLHRVRPILQPMGSKIIYVGGQSRANVMKLALNMILGLEMQALAEAYTLASKAGIAPDTIADAISSSGMSSKVINGKLRLLKQNDYKRRFGLAYIQKDFMLALDEADRLRVSVPATAVANETAKVGLAQGLARADFAALYVVLARMAGMSVEPSQGKEQEEPAQAI